MDATIVTATAAAPGVASPAPGAVTPPSPQPDAADKNPPSHGADGKGSEAVAVDGASSRPLSLSDAIETAFRLQPRLRVYLEGVEQARGGEQVAFAPFLPTAAAGYHVGGFPLNAGGEGVPVSSSTLPVAF